MDGHLLRYNKNVTYALIDLETCNLCLNFRINRPWQIGVVFVRGEKIEDAKDIRVDLKWSDDTFTVGQEAAMVTRFNPEDHKKLGINYKDAFNKFWPMLQAADKIIMHNGLNFDLYLLRDYAKFMGEDWKWILPKVIDTKSLAQGIKMNIPYQPKDGDFIEYQYRMGNAVVKGIKTSLKILGPEYKIEHDYEHLHDAIVDLELNLKIWNHIKYQVEI